MAYVVVLALLGAAGFYLWTGGRGGPSGLAGSGSVSPVTPKAPQSEPGPSVQGLSLPRRVEPKATPPAQKEPEQAPAILPSPSQSETSNSDLAASTPATKEPAQEPAVAVAPPPSPGDATNSDPAGPASKQPEPPKTTCAADIGAWPVNSTDQVKAIQVLLRDLDLYSGTTHGTLGPATRMAIRTFQRSADQAETGEPSEMLFDALKKKKCASSAR